MIRRDQAELLDLGVGSFEEVCDNFDDLWWINRYLGGMSFLKRHVYPSLKAGKQAITIVDLGAGSGEIAASIIQWGQRQGIKVQVTAADLASRHLEIARSRTSSIPTITLIQADALCLPLAPNSVDFVISSLFLHHFTPEQITHILKSAFACAKHGIIMNDLIRGWLPLIGFKLIQPLFVRNYLTRHDGEISIRRAYTPSELMEIAHCANLTNIRLYPYWPWRMTLIAEK